MRRAVSPVIATVILIAVAVALGIAVAVWAGALTNSLTRSEKLIIVANAPNDNLVVLTITNQSPTQVTIQNAFFNNVQVSGFVPLSIDSGDTSQLNITSSGVHSGISYPITLVTASGNSYPASVVMP